MPMWSKSFFIEFLKMYQSEECLWNQLSDHYTNRMFRKEAYERLRRKLSEVDPEATEESVVKRINNLRSIFLREFRKVQQYRTFGCEYVPRLWYYEHLEFLSDQVIMRENNCYHRKRDMAQRINNDLDREYRSSGDEGSEEQIPPPLMVLKNKDVKVEADASAGDATDGNIVYLDPDLKESDIASRVGLDLEVFPISQDDTLQVMPERSVDQFTVNAPTSSARTVKSEPSIPRQQSKRKATKVEKTVRKLVHRNPRKHETVQNISCNDLVGKTYAGKLRLLRRNQRICAEKLICDVLFHAEFGHLSSSCHIDIGKTSVNVCTQTTQLEHPKKKSPELPLSYFKFVDMTHHFSGPSQSKC